MINVKFKKVVITGFLSLLLFISILGTLSFYFQGLQIQEIGICFAVIGFICNLLFFPYNSNLKNRIHFLFFSTGLFWLFHVVVVIYSGNWIQLFPNLSLLIVIISFLYVNQKKNLIIPFFSVLIFLLLGLKIIKWNSKVDVATLLKKEPLTGTYFREASKPQIIEFWYSSCSICIENFDAFDKFYQKNKDKYDILSVNIEIDTDKKRNFDPVNFIKEKGYKFPVMVMSPDYAESTYQIFSTPKTMIVKNDTIILKENIIATSDLVESIFSNK
ncbi:TlpA disulfide reductase family protein [Nonlabens sp. MIC269]|uniref:TlpA disulfide reductase family protein n=1 Tax=Nonlabens sp. MIC269 TaxID=1476901 RepID=UPI000760ECC4|nr:TlpA disulfide reductase family protein [Nonlabens sp. MIC269]